MSIALNGEAKEDVRVSLQDGSLLQPPLQDLSPFLPVEETPAVAVARPDVKLLLVQAQRNVRKILLDGSIWKQLLSPCLIAITEVCSTLRLLLTFCGPPASLFPWFPSPDHEPQPQSKPESALAEVPVASAAAKSDEPLALRILKEYWGPNTTGRNRHAQRLFTVLLNLRTAAKRL